MYLDTKNHDYDKSVVIKEICTSLNENRTPTVYLKVGAPTCREEYSAKFEDLFYIGWVDYQKYGYHTLFEPHAPTLVQYTYYNYPTTLCNNNYE